MGYIEELRNIIGHRPVILVGSVVLIIDEENRVLLQQRKTTSYGKWGVPGGLMELGESTEETARREIYEETGLSIGSLNLIDIHSGKESYIKVPNGDEFYAVTVVYYTKEFSGEINIDRNESLDFKFYPIDELPEKMVESHRKFIKGYLEKVK